MPKKLQNMHIEAQIGLRIRSLRLAANQSQSDLAGALGLTFQQVQKYERGTNRIALSRAMQIAKILNTSVNELIGNGVTIDVTNKFDNEAYKMSGAMRRLGALSPVIAKRMRALIDGICDDLMAERRKAKRKGPGE